MASLQAKRDALLAALSRLESCAVAFSGGVDSAVVAKAAATLALETISATPAEAEA